VVELLQFLNGKVEIVTKAFKFFGDAIDTAKKFLMEFFNIPLKSNFDSLTESIEFATKEFQKFNKELEKSNFYADLEIKKLQALQAEEQKILNLKEKRNQRLLGDLELQRTITKEALRAAESDKKLLVDKEEIKKAEENILKLQTQYADIFKRIRTVKGEIALQEIEQYKLESSNNLKRVEAALKRKNDLEEEKRLLQELAKLEADKVDLYAKENAQRKLAADIAAAAAGVEAEVAEDILVPIRKAREQAYKEQVESINAINQVAMAGLSAYAEMANESTNRQIEQLQESIVGIDQIISDSQTKQNEALSRQVDAENQLADARGNRRKRLLNDIAAEKKAQEEAQKAEIKAQKEKAEIENQIRKKEAEAVVKSLQIETAGLALQIGVTSALAIAKLAAKSASQDPTFGIATIASISALGISLGVNIAKMRALSRDIEKFEDGGMIVGNSHKDGGVKASVGGRRNIELEGGEYVINKRSTSKYQSILEKINKDKFADGGIVLPTTNNDIMMSLMDRPIYVSVQDINTGMDRYARVTELGSF
jgi:hypothetical protein